LHPYHVHMFLTPRLKNVEAVEDQQTEYPKSVNIF
jgi:hypothetical protein